MQQSPPKRIILRFHEDHCDDERAINSQVFGSHGLGAVDDYYSHLIPPDEESNKMHIVLDMYCKTNLTVELETIEYQVYKVKKNKNDNLYVVVVAPLESLSPNEVPD
jgi:hypothetical protein